MDSVICAALVGLCEVVLDAEYTFGKKLSFWRLVWSFVVEEFTLRIFELFLQAVDGDPRCD